MDILFIGGVFSEGQQKEILRKSNGVVQFAANVLQWNLIHGLDANSESPVSILNAMFVGAYPRHYSDFYLKSRNWSHILEATDKDIGFLNLPLIKHLWKGKAIAKQAIKWGKSNLNNKKTIIIYSMHTPFIYAAAMAKRKNPDIHICLVVPDLPEFMNLTSANSKIFNVLKGIDRTVMDAYLKYVDSFVLLTRYMEGPVGVGNRPWIEMEGVVDSKDIVSESINFEKDVNKKIVLYTGTLNKLYGIMNLLNAFSMIKDIDNSYRLWICGAGEAEEDIIKVAQVDSRIKFYGQVTRNEAIELQRKATVLINPRSNEGEFTKYSFPSKVMEYLLSGTPTIVKKLPGMPHDYFNYLFTVDGDSDEDITKKIVEVCSLPHLELFEFGMRAREYVLKEKNYNKQAKRILELVSNSNVVKLKNQ
ncbi:glycosyltransferase [Paenibacillus lignilyticus]|uniref:Glycosyltransferase n=1 Tax=Paenibacillus lignilyticus TaxID=1172615 RepID=A0ABS5CG24_9BACL|nr:glycosyltransferase [Paenibacillus lignilyticus]MBP3964819.1 glycosyltransferase [Paenibacillus lignilyticus]